MQTAQTWPRASMLIFQLGAAGASSSSLQVARQSSFSTPCRRPRRITTSPCAWQPPLVSYISCSSPKLTSAEVEQRRSLWCSVHHSYQHCEPLEKVLSFYRRYGADASILHRSFPRLGTACNAPRQALAKKGASIHTLMHPAQKKHNNNRVRRNGLFFIVVD